MVNINLIEAISLWLLHMTLYLQKHDNILLFPLPGVKAQKQKTSDWKFKIMVDSCRHIKYPLCGLLVLGSAMGTDTGRNTTSPHVQTYLVHFLNISSYLEISSSDIFKPTHPAQCFPVHQVQGIPFFSQLPASVRATHAEWTASSPPQSFASSTQKFGSV